MCNQVSEISTEYRNATSILLYLCKVQEDIWKSNDLSQVVSDTYNRLIYPKGIFTYDHLEKKLDNNWQSLKNDHKSRKFILGLPPLHNGYVPALRINYEEERDEIGFEVVFYLYNRDENKPSSYGFRFEQPHRGSQACSGIIHGMHEYHHAQIVTHIRSVPLNIPEHMGELNDSIPCIPLPADGLVSLILCMYLSIYGRRKFYELMKAVHVPRNYFEPMKCIEK